VCVELVIFLKIRNEMSFRRGRGVGNGRFSGGRDMDSGRGRGGGRDSGPPRGADRLSNHTSDASMASARIFVGNLPTNDPRLTKELLEENLSQYGHIMGRICCLVCL